jgi:hypothetical protein
VTGRQRIANILKPIAASAIFVALVIYFTYHFNNRTELGLFISSPFNMSTENHPAYNLYLPALLIFMVGIYLKNFNRAFMRKCSLRAVFTMGILASYMKSIGSMFYYRGYADYGISLGTSIITLAFFAAFVISLEVYIENKEHVEHLYGRFLFSILTVLLILLSIFIFLSYFASSSLVVHLMGLTSFLLLFIPYYERANIMKEMRKGKDGVKAIRTRLKQGTESLSANGRPNRKRAPNMAVSMG